MAGMHFGRQFHGHQIEDLCECPQAPCGLIENAKGDCPQHGPMACKTMRQGHDAADCPGTLTLNHTSNVPAPSRADDAAEPVLIEPREMWRALGVREPDGFMDDPADKVRRARALGDRLRACSEHRVQECGAFIGEALDGTLDEAKLVAFLRGRS